MKRILSAIEKKYVPESEAKASTMRSGRLSSPNRGSLNFSNKKKGDNSKEKWRGSINKSKGNEDGQGNQSLNVPLILSDKSLDDNVTDEVLKSKVLKSENKDLHNKLSLERINFDFEDYGKYPGEQFQPSVFFFKYLSIRPEYEEEKKKEFKRLKLYVPDTLVFNDAEVNFWVYSDEGGYVRRCDIFTDNDVLEKFKSKKSENKDKELIGVFKSPVYKGNLLEGNHLEILNQEELEKHLFSKASTPCILQRYIKCKGPKAFLCRSVYRRNRLPYVYIFTNKAGYSENILNQQLKFILNSKKQESYFIFYTNSGKHLEETNFYMSNIVKFIESNSDIVIDELVCDFVKDEADIWWMINCKALKVKNINKFLDQHGNPMISPNLEKFCNMRNSSDHHDKIKKFDYQTKLKCKFCGISFNKANLKYNLTTKMILETDKQLKHLNIHLNYIDRPDLSHTDSSMIYLPYRVCEECYLLFETMNDIKNYQIKIANFFRVNVDHINFGVDYFNRPSVEDYENIGVNSLLEKRFVKENKSIELLYNLENKNINKAKEANKRRDNITKVENTAANHLYRIMIIFSDMFWNEEVVVPDKELYLLFNFLNINIKAKVKKYYKDLDYFNINFFKIFYLACNPDEGFIEYFDKNRTMLVKLGYFEEKNTEVKPQPTGQKKENRDKLDDNIIIEDPDICTNIDSFVQFASVELSIQGLKYGEKYRNTLNGLLFKEHKPHYTGKLRCTIRINQEKPVDVSILNCRKHYNFYIPPIHFVTPEELPDYWLEIVERQKLRENILESIIKTIDLRMEDFEKRKYKEEIFQTLESLISQYLVKDSN